MCYCYLLVGLVGYDSAHCVFAEVLVFCFLCIVGVAWLCRVSWNCLLVLWCWLAVIACLWVCFIVHWTRVWVLIVLFYVIVIYYVCVVLVEFFACVVGLLGFGLVCLMSFVSWIGAPIIACVY